MEILLFTLGAIAFMMLVDLAALRWSKDSREIGDVPEWIHHHSPKSI
ncbi:MAG TPA: hypothetical protein VFU63_00565 [Ktedonobacterales bacterium]|nr:hypothetical protein [Ktedonobacterales bacterium]